MKALFWGFFVVGFIAVAAAIYYGADTYMFLNGAGRAVGRVDTLIERGKTGERGEHTMTSPRVSFTIADGSIIRFTPESGSYPPAYRQGDQVPVLYRPEQPFNARIESYMNLYFASTIAAVLGIVFVICALLVKRFDRKGWGVYSREGR